MISFRDIDFKKIKYSLPEKHENHYKSIISYDGEDFLLITNNLNLNNDKLILDEEFKKIIEGLDEHSINKTYENRELWFKKDIPSTIIRGMYEKVLDGDKLEILNCDDINVEDNKVILHISELIIQRKSFKMIIKLLNIYHDEYDEIEIDLIEDIDNIYKKEKIEKEIEELIKERFDIEKKINECKEKLNY